MTLFKNNLKCANFVVCFRYEIDQIRSVSYMRAVNASFVLFLSRFSMYLCVLTYVFTGNTLKAEYVYVVTSYYSILRQSLTMFLPRGITLLAETHVSIKRIQKFLSYNEIQLDQEKSVMTNGCSQITEILLTAVHIKNASVKWSPAQSDYTLENINFDVNSQELVAVVGPVGSGKTTLLHILLKELGLLDGSISIVGTISYASQEPWLFAASVRQNILFGEPLDAIRYQEVIRVCALERDFSLFPYGDRTIVGERGVMLSGGQKARINLARAIYKSADIYLLDDPLSAVDAHVGKQLFEDCIKGFLRNKCIVLVTHQLQYISDADKIYLLENGKISASGTYSELRNSGGEFVKLLEEETNKHEKREIKKADVRQLKSLKSLEKSDTPLEVKEHRKTGSLSKQVYMHYLKAGGHYAWSVLILILFVFAQSAGSGADLFVTFWVNLEQEKLEQNYSSLKTNRSEENGYNFKYEFFTINNLVYFYTALMVFLIVVTLTRSLSFFKVCMRASTNLHNRMFGSIVFTTLRFFNTNPSGRILNRFAKDIGSIDETLPISITDTMQVSVKQIPYIF